MKKSREERYTYTHIKSWSFWTWSWTELLKWQNLQSLACGFCRNQLNNASAAVFQFLRWEQVWSYLCMSLESQRNYAGWWKHVRCKKGSSFITTNNLKHNLFFSLSLYMEQLPQYLTYLRNKSKIVFYLEERNKCSFK